jgi:5-methylthioadenosine/S-adenosylhomocysteine deaminase
VTAPKTVDTIVEHAYIVTFDDAGTVLADGSIAIADGAITAVGEAADIAAAYTAAEVIDGHHRLAMPGLIDAHTHIAQTMMKGLFPELQRKGKQEWPVWRRYLIPFEANLSGEDMELSMQLAAANMLAHGTTTFYDAGGPHPHHTARAALATGMRGMIGRSTLDDSTEIPESMRMTTDEAIEENIRLVEDYPAGGLITGSMALRQIMNCSPELITTIHAEALARGAKVHSHLLEGTDEIDYAVARYGKRPIDFLIDLGVFDETLHAAHAVYATPWDVQKFREYGPSVAHCRNNYNFGTPRALEYWRAGVPIGLGTDGAATSQGMLDMFRIASGVTMGQQYTYGPVVHELDAIAPDEALQMATRGGAAALGMAGRIGQLTAESRADIVLLDLDSVDASVSVTPFSYLVDGATGHDVDTVLVDGRTVVSAGQVLTVDVDRVVAKARTRQIELVNDFNVF